MRSDSPAQVSAGLNRYFPGCLDEGIGSIDSIFGDGSMPKPCSLELRERVVGAVESGASRREAAEWFGREPQFGNQMDAAAA